MADGTLGYDETNNDKLLDTEELTVGANTVHRERMRLAGANAADLAPVSATTGLTVNSAQLPASLGQKTMAASHAVVLASDQSSIPVTVAGVATAALQGGGLPAALGAGGGLKVETTTQGTLLASAARTASVYTNVVNSGGGTLIVILNVTAKAAATTLQVDLRESGSGANASWAQSAAFAAAVGANYVAVFGPGYTTADYTAGGVTGTVTNKNVAVPSAPRIGVIVSDANSVTYSAYYYLV